MHASSLLFSIAALVVAGCQMQPKETVVESPTKEKYELLGYESKVAWGEHLVTIGVCDDCHSPKIMTENGPEPDPSLRLSGHPASMEPANLDRKVIEQNGYGACNPHLTSWIGPWGISYAANLTSDPTGIGNWTEENFFRAIREGKFKGLENGRMLLPPMPWPNYRYMTDDELSAIFAFLKTVPPVKNVVPNPQPPVSAVM